MGGLLSEIYSAGDRMKRKLGGLLSNPLENIALGSTRMAEDMNALSALAYEAGLLPGSKTVLTSERQKTNALRQLAEQGTNMGANMVGATVWHGSPHKFDKFDSSKIGTGEGAQAYGHGLYVAENPAVAEDYKKALSTVVKVDGRPVLANNQSYKTGNPIIDDNLIAANGDLRAAIKDQLQATRDARQVGRQNGRIDGVKEFQRELADLRALRGRVETTTDGALYKVDLPDNAIAKMLDWDAPLSKQATGVQALLPAIGKATRGYPYDWRKDLKMGDAYRQMVGDIGGEAKASQALREAGIPGIRYLDGGSRGAGQGSSNYVVFPGNESLLQILERNGVPVK